MVPDLHITIHNILSVITILLMIGLSLFTYLNGRKNVVNITTALILFMAVIFVTSHVIGVNVADHIISRNILMFNLCIFIAGAIQIHSALAIVGKAHKEKWFIIFVYASAIAFTIYFIVHHELFLLPSTEKMYFPNYYVPGILNITRVIFLNIIANLYMTYILVRASYTSNDPLEKKQYMYMAATMTIGYAIIFIPNFLVYDIPVDPIWGFLFAPVMIVPFLYGAIKYEMLHIKIIAKHAFIFAMAVSAVGSIIALLNYSNIWIRQFFPSYPLWVGSLISAILTVILSVIVWNILRKNDLLKYEFITTVTHKFRTPLTHIKWSAENLSKTRLPPEADVELHNIISADAKLVELTNLLVNVTEIEESSYEYNMRKADLSHIVKETACSMSRQFTLKHISVTKEMDPGLYIKCDVSRIQFVIQTLMENAVNYSSNGSTIHIVTVNRGRDNIFSITDSGIGITDDELPYLFCKFYRGTAARAKDTEGMGIGLYMSKQIIERHGGKLTAGSSGKDRGSTFTIRLPAIG